MDERKRSVRKQTTWKRITNIPLSADGTPYAILSGLVDLAALHQVFQPELYGGAAAFCVIDSKDGNLVMDSWHEKLSSLHELPSRKRLAAYEGIDMQAEIRNLQSGNIAYESKSTGLDTYVRYCPVGIFDWKLLVFAQEDVIFKELFYVRKLLLLVGLAEIVLRKEAKRRCIRSVRLIWI